RTLAGPWLDGSASFTDDLTRVLGSVSSGDVQNLTVSALLMQLMRGTSGAATGQVRQLLAAAEELGLAGMTVSSLAGGGGAGAAAVAAEPGPSRNGAA
ncbi:MAG TPA: hypothetical protein DD420_00210, partial [Streptomyces sp.]|nr:hypothetical protein [Streptomyces sp.]